MLLLLQAGVLLCCAALCFTSPLPPTTAPDCPSSSFIREILRDIQTMRSKASSKILLQNNPMKAGGNMTTYLGGFIEALRRSKERSEEILLAHKLQEIQDAPKLCLEQMEEDWEPQEDDFFDNLKHFLKFLNHHGPQKRK